MKTKALNNPGRNRSHAFFQHTVILEEVN